jgi:hypothetical protein
MNIHAVSICLPSDYDREIPKCGNMRQECCTGIEDTKVASEKFTSFNFSRTFST